MKKEEEKLSDLLSCDHETIPNHPVNKNKVTLCKEEIYILGN